MSVLQLQECGVTLSLLLQDWVLVLLRMPKYCEVNQAKRQGECDCRVEVNASSSKVTQHSWLSTASGSCAEGAQGMLFVVLVCFCYIVILNLPFISQFDAKERLIMHSTLSNPYRTVLRSS